MAGLFWTDHQLAGCRAAISQQARRLFSLFGLHAFTAAVTGVAVRIALLEVRAGDRAEHIGTALPREPLALLQFMQAIRATDGISTEMATASDASERQARFFDQQQISTQGRKMDQAAAWFEQHDKLAGWAQFFGSMLALLLTYFTAFAPGWRRKRQLHGEAKRLLMHGYEVVESFHRTSAHFAPFPLSLKQASLSMTGLIDDIGRFPIYELDENFGRLSIARRLTAMRLSVSAVRLYLDELAMELGGRTANEEEHAALIEMVGERLKFAEALLVGREMTRPEWPGEESANTPSGAGG